MRFDLAEWDRNTLTPFVRKKNYGTRIYNEEQLQIKRFHRSPCSSNL